MTSEPQKISIADWQNLTVDTESAIDRALRHLKQRQAASRVEAKQIEDWKNRLKQHAVVIGEIRTGYEQGSFKKTKPGEEQKFIILNDRVQLAKEQVQRLPRQDFRRAERALRQLVSHTKMFLSVGPHGPVRPPLPKPTRGQGGIKKPRPEAEI